jgi:PAS domain S-box-containing protein
MNLHALRATIRSRPVYAYGLAVGLAVAALGLRLLFWDLLPGFPYLGFVAVVAVAAALGGTGPGIFAALLSSGLGLYFLTTPGHTLAPPTNFEAGRVIFFLAVCAVTIAVVRFADTTSQRLSEARDELLRLNQELSRRLGDLQDRETRLGLAVRAAGAGIWEWRLDTDEMIFSDRAKAIYGFPADQPLSRELVRSATHPEDRAHTVAQAKRALDPAIRDSSPYRYRVVRPSGEICWLVAHGEVVFEERGGQTVPVRYVGTLVDVTEQKLAEDRLRLLAREVDHRANNLLAVIQGAVALSKASTVAELKAVISGRVQALGRANQLLSEGRWQGADLRRLVEEELMVFGLGEGSPMTIDGPDASLPPALAQSLAMALHELATNAAKYGALSMPSGRVSVTWRRAADGALHLRWQETGGPPVVKPSKTGFGSAVLQRALSGSTGGEVQMQWRPEGVVCELALPPPQAQASAASEKGTLEPDVAG